MSVLSLPDPNLGRDGESTHRNPLKHFERLGSNEVHILPQSVSEYPKDFLSLFHYTLTAITSRLCGVLKLLIDVTRSQKDSSLILPLGYDVVYLFTKVEDCFRVRCPYVPNRIGSSPGVSLHTTPWAPHPPNVVRRTTSQVDVPILTPYLTIPHFAQVHYPEQKPSGMRPRYDLTWCSLQ